MAFDAATYAAPTPTETEGEILCPVWAAANPDKALAFLFVAPHDSDAVDALMAA